MSNLYKVNPPNATQAFSTPSSTTKGLETVRIALERNLTTEEYNRVVNGFRRSNASSQGVIDDFMRIDIPFHSVIRDEHYEKAISITKALFKPDKPYRPVHYCDLRWYPWPLSSSVEAPFIDNADLKRRVLEAHQNDLLPNANMNFRNCYNEVFVQNRHIVHQIKDGMAKGDKFFAYAKAHARAHLVETIEEDKVRMVYGIPKLLLMVELMLLWPFMQWLRHGITPMAWGFEILTGGFYKLQRCFESWNYQINTVLCLDWKQFDKRALFEVINDVHTMWHSWIVFDKGYIPTRDYHDTTSQSERMNNLFRWMSNAVKFMKVRLPDGSEWKRRFASIGSGLMQTQVLDSMVNCIMLLTCLSSLGFEVTTDLFIKLMGDDSLIGLKEFVPEGEFDDLLNRIAMEAKHRFGAILNVKKSIIKRNLQGAHFLGFVNNATRPERDPYALLAQLLYPERRVTMPKLMARAIGIAYADCGVHKFVYNVCKEVYSYGAQLGYTPDAEEATFLYFLKGIQIVTDHFPDITEIQKFLVEPLESDPANDNSFWNRDHFLSEY